MAFQGKATGNIAGVLIVCKIYCKAFGLAPVRT